MPGSWEVEADTHRVHQTDLHIVQLGHQTLLDTSQRRVTAFKIFLRRVKMFPLLTVNRNADYS